MLEEQHKNPQKNLRRVSGRNVEGLVHNVNVRSTTKESIPLIACVNTTVVSTGKIHLLNRINLSAILT